MYERTKHLEKQIFEQISPQALQQLMAKRTDLNFINESIDVAANVGEAFDKEFYFNILAIDSCYSLYIFTIAFAFSMAKPICIRSLESALSVTACLTAYVSINSTRARQTRVSS